MPKCQTAYLLEGASLKNNFQGRWKSWDPAHEESLADTLPDDDSASMEPPFCWVLGVNGQNVHQAECKPSIRWL